MPGARCPNATRDARPTHVVRGSDASSVDEPGMNARGTTPEWNSTARPTHVVRGWVASLVDEPGMNARGTTHECNSTARPPLVVRGWVASSRRAGHECPGKHGPAGLAHPRGTGIDDPHVPIFVEQNFSRVRPAVSHTWLCCLRHGRLSAVPKQTSVPSRFSGSRIPSAIRSSRGSGARSAAHLLVPSAKTVVTRRR